MLLQLIAVNRILFLINLLVKLRETKIYYLIETYTLSFDLELL